MNGTITHRGGHGRALLTGLAAVTLAAIAFTWAWTSVAVTGFGLAPLGFVPALALTAALVAAGAAFGLGLRLAGTVRKDPA